MTLITNSLYIDTNVHMIANVWERREAFAIWGSLWQPVEFEQQSV